MYVNFILCFDGSNPLILVLNGDVIIFARCPEWRLIWCQTISARDDNFRDTKDLDRLLLMSSLFCSVLKVQQKVVLRLCSFSSQRAIIILEPLTDESRE
jgi:hypothetical protein